ncbi:MAG: NADAR domain-containing protein [Bacteroidia bacterium]|nr:NADAR domain-containing protein [Bacteroidia bacterium]
MTYNFENYCILPTDFGEFHLYDTKDENVRLISFSPIEKVGNNPLLRIHSSCIASEVFGARDCDCADQLREAMKLIANESRGLIIHIHQEGRGHGLSKKIEAVSIMQKHKCDTVESFIQLGLEQDIREYDVPVTILKSLDITSVRLISNNPLKKNFLTKHNIAVEIIHTHPKIRAENKDYLFSKNAKLGHSLPLNEEETTEVIQFYHSDQKWGEFANFSKHAIYLDEKIWKTVEHFYQAQKFHNTKFEEIIRLTDTPTLAKQKAYEFLKKNPVLNWNDKKEEIMWRGLKAKFTQHPELQKLLFLTENKILVERTDFDNFWGDGKDGKGKNRLGRLLMRLRSELKGKNIEIIETHRKNIENYFNIQSELKLLGSGAEGTVFTDYKFVYKSFLGIFDHEWSFLKEKSTCFGKNDMLYEIDFFENDNFKIIRYEYQPSKPLVEINPSSLIEFLKFSKLNNFVFVNIKPNNFIQTLSGQVKLIDYGRSIEPFTEENLQNATKRSFLLWKNPTMKNDDFQRITPKINNGEVPNEIIGWEQFWNDLNNL